VKGIFIYIYLFVLNIPCEYLSSKKLLDSNLESSTRVTRVTRHSPSLGPGFKVGVSS